MRENENPLTVKGREGSSPSAPTTSQKLREPNIEPDDEELWAPEGYSFYGGELIPHKPSRHTPQEQLAILDTHPFFTGRCPKCSYQFDRKNPPAVHWDCPRCGWIDDSV